MGQRHQLIIIAPTSVYANDPNATGKTAWHSQWLYGTLPLGVLARLLRFGTRDEDHKWETFAFNGRLEMESFSQIVNAVMSFDYDNQSFMRFSREGAYLEDDYRAGDNNDGVTVLQFIDGEKPKYCLMTGPETGGNSMAEGRAMSADEYLECYYPVGKGLTGNLRKHGLELATEIDSMATLMTDSELAELFPKPWKDPK